LQVRDAPHPDLQLPWPRRPPVTTARAALAVAAARFGFSATPRLDAELLLAHALGIERPALLLDLDQPVPPAFAALVERRAAHEPVAYITGRRGFWSVDLAVGPGALVPRADSETLVEAAVAHVAAPPATVLDLGTGPGTLLCALLAEWPGARGIGVDRSPAALRYARANLAALGQESRAHLVLGDWAGAIAGRFDCIVSNPPYIGTAEPLPDEVAGHEPAGALFAGADGLDAYRALVPQLPRLLAPGGVALLEIGATQAAAVSGLVAAAGLVPAVHQDLGGRDRCIVATA
jgi:release factor glutamine methyltransferase